MPECTSRGDKVVLISDLPPWHRNGNKSQCTRASFLPCLALGLLPTCYLVRYCSAPNGRLTSEHLLPGACQDLSHNLSNFSWLWKVTPWHLYLARGLHRLRGAHTSPRHPQQQTSPEDDFRISSLYFMHFSISRDKWEDQVGQVCVTSELPT